MERILVLGMSKDCGGIENYILNLYENINLQIIQFDFLVKEDVGDTFKERIEKLGGHIYTIGTFKKDVLGVWKRLNDFYRVHSYKKIYVNLSYAPALIYVLPAIKNGLNKLYIHSHASNDIRIIKHKIFRFLFLNGILHKTQCIYMGCSEAACKWMFGEKIVRNNPMHVINNAIDYSKFCYDIYKRNYIKEKYQIENAFVVGHIGRFSIEKNHIFIIEAFNKLKHIKPNCKLMLVGEGEMREEIEGLVKEYGLENDVIFVGNVSDTSYYYDVMDCFWLPSLYEGFPMVAVEAQLSGLQCIFSNTIDRKVDILGNNYFAKLDDADQWVALTSKLKKKNRKIEHYVWRQTGYDLEEQVTIIEQLLGGE